MLNRTSRIVMTPMLAAVFALVAVGCGSSPTPPPGPVQQRSDTGRMQPVPVAYLNELVEDAAQTIVRQLPENPRIRQAPTQQVLMVHPRMVNEANWPDGAVSEALSTLVGRLTNAEPITDNFVILVGTAADADRTIRQTEGDTAQFRDPLQGGGEDTTAARQYHPDLIYTLTGRFWLTDAGDGLRSYRMSIRVQHERTRQLVLDRTVQKLLRWDGRRNRWVPTD
ncbi:MAG: hypothetical protein JJU36_05490 [Phycisphaeraceae bacterium]|nr:hypothetical protein [Phycisphaeraceae bacterium]